MMRRIIVFAAVALTTIAPGAASADHPDGALGVTGMSERQLQAFESRVLGPGHAAEHAQARAVESQASAEPARALRSAQAQAQASTASVLAQGSQLTRKRCLTARRGALRKLRLAKQTGKPLAPDSRRRLQRLARRECPPKTWTGLAASGRWRAPFSIPVMAIHGAMLPTGKVLWFSYPVNPNPKQGGLGHNAPNTAQAWLWNPRTRKNKRVDPPLWRDPADGQLKPANIWCAGQTFLEDGRVLVVGGNLGYSNVLDFKGLNKAYTFNPWNETWTEQPDMAHGRWYPTAYRLPDGRVVIMAGRDETGVTPGNSNKDDRAVHALDQARRGRHDVAAGQRRRLSAAAQLWLVSARLPDAVRARADRRPAPA